MPPRKTIPKTRNGGTMTEAAFWGWIRSNLRRLSLRWTPRNECRKRARRAYVGPNKRQKWEYQCAHCGEWFMGKDIDVDHVIDCGSLTKYSDIGSFVERLLCEADNLRVLCKPCHKERHNAPS